MINNMTIGKEIKERLQSNELRLERQMIESYKAKEETQQSNLLISKLKDDFEKFKDHVAISFQQIDLPALRGDLKEQINYLEG